MLKKTALFLGGASLTLMVVVMMMIANLLLGVGEGIGSVGWDGGFFDGLGGAGGT